MEEVSQRAAFISTVDNPGEIDTFAGGIFTANLTSKTEMTLTSVAFGTVSQTIDGYNLLCLNTFSDIVVGDEEISIPGKLALETVKS